MAADLDNPKTSQSDTDYAQAERDNQAELAKMSGAFAHLVVGVKRWATNKLEEWNGSAWVAAAATWAINVATVAGFTPGHANGNIPISDGTVNTNLNADLLDGHNAGTGANDVLLLDGSGKMPGGVIPATAVGAGAFNLGVVGADGRLTSKGLASTLAGLGITDGALKNGSASELFSVAVATAVAHALRLGQYQQAGAITTICAGGPTVYTATMTPTLASYATIGNLFLIGNGGSTNSGTTPTMNIDGLGAITMERADRTPLRPGDFPTTGWALCSVFWTGVLGTSRVHVHSLPPRASYGKKAREIMAGAIQPRASQGCSPLQTIAGGGNQADMYVLDFDGATVEYGHFHLIMPPSWNEGTITFKVHWRHGATTVNFGTTWALRAVAVGDGEALPDTLGTVVEVTDTGGTADTLYVSDESGPVTVAGSPAAGNLVEFIIYRNTGAAGDTLAVDARLLGLVLYFTTDTENDA